MSILDFLGSVLLATISSILANKIEQFVNRLVQRRKKEEGPTHPE